MSSPASFSDDELREMAASGRPPAAKAATAPLTPTVDASGMSKAELEYMAKTGKRLPEYATGEAKTRGAYQGYTYEFGDELAGGMQAAIDTVTSPFTGDPRSIPERYTESRDELRARNARAQEVDPVGYYGGELVGGIVSPNPLGKGSAVAQGLKYGALTGAGASEANPLEDPVQTLKDTAVGAGVGAVAGKVLPPVIEGAIPVAKAVGKTVADTARRVPGVQAVEDFARAGGAVVGDFATGIGRGVQGSLERGLSRSGREQAANVQAAKAAGLQGIADTNRLGGTDALQEVGQYIRESGLVNPRRLDRESIQAEAQLRLDQAGQVIGETRKAMREAGVGPDTDEVIDGIRQIQGSLEQLRGTLPQVDAVLRVGDNVIKALEANTMNAGTTTNARARQIAPEFLDEMKGYLDDELFAIGDTGNLQARLSKPAQQMRGEIRKLFKELEENVADQLHPTIGEKFRAAKSEYGNLKDVLYLAGRGEKRDLSNKAISLTDWQLLGPAASEGPGGLLGVAAYGAKVAGERFGNASAANVLASPKTDAALALGPAAAQGASKLANAAWSKLLDVAELQGPRALSMAAASLVRANPDARWEILNELERRRAAGGEFDADPKGVSATMRPIPQEELSDRRAKTNVRKTDSAELLEAIKGRRASIATERGNAAPAAAPKGKQSFVILRSADGRMTGAQTADRRVSFTRGKDGRIASGELEDL